MWTCQGVTTLREFWARSAHFGQNGCWEESRGARVFLCCNPEDFRQLRNGRLSPNLVTKHSSVSSCEIHKDIFENFQFRCHLTTKSEIENPSNRHLTQNRLQVMGCTVERYCLLHVVVQRPGSFEGQVNFSVRCTVAELRGGGQICTIFGFWPIFPIQTPKTYLPVTKLQPIGYIAE